MANGSLALIGIGISDEKDISLRGLDTLKACDIVFAESYTNLMAEGTLDRLSKLCGKKITLLSREQVEGEKEILAAAKISHAALIIPGDPLIATTHISLVIAAKKAKISVTIVHSSSILSAAIAESGLQAYKFGKIITLPHWRDNYKPTSTYGAIVGNKTRGLHTLVFLDIDEKLGPLDAKKALEMLLVIEEEKKSKITTPESNAIVLSRVGYPEQKISFGKISELLAKDVGKPPFILVFPAALHFMEEEWLSLVSPASRSGAIHQPQNSQPVTPKK